MTKTFRLATFSALFLALASPAAFAEAFVVASGGVTRWSSDCSATSSCETRGNAVTARAGYWFTPYFALEARYVDLGKMSAEFPAGIGFTDTTSTVIYASGEQRASGGGAGVVVSFPVGAGFTVGAVGGFMRLKSRSRTTIPDFGAGLGNSLSDETSQSATRGYYGLRVGYPVWKDIDASLEAERYRPAFEGGNLSVDVFALGLTYRFR